MEEAWSEGGRRRRALESALLFSPASTLESCNCGVGVGVGVDVDGAAYTEAGQQEEGGGGDGDGGERLNTWSPLQSLFSPHLVLSSRCQEVTHCPQQHISDIKNY